MLHALDPFFGSKQSLDLVPVSSTFPITPQQSSEGLTRWRPTCCVELHSFAASGGGGVASFVSVFLGLGVWVGVGGVSVVAGRLCRSRSAFVSWFLASARQKDVAGVGGRSFVFFLACGFRVVVHHR